MLMLQWDMILELKKFSERVKLNKGFYLNNRDLEVISDDT